jgi:hypothetical protein
MVRSPAAGVEARFQSMSTEEYRQHLKSTHNFSDEVSLTLAENLSAYRDNPRMWMDNTDIDVQDVRSDSRQGHGVYLVVTDKYTDTSRFEDLE